MRDLEIIENIEKLLDIKLENTDALSVNTDAYITKNEHVVGVSISGVDFSGSSTPIYFEVLYMLKELEQLERLFLSNNGITDISPLQDFKQLRTIFFKRQSNC